MDVFTELSFWFLSFSHKVLLTWYKHRITCLFTPDWIHCYSNLTPPVILFTYEQLKEDHRIGLKFHDLV